MNLQTIHTIYYRYSVPGKGHDLTHSEIVRMIIDNADVLAESLRKGYDIEIRLYPRLHSLKAYEVRKHPLIGIEAVQGVLSDFNTLG